jgi:hypothetical protein
MPVILGRRELIAALGGAAVTLPLAALAQQAEHMRRIGVLMNGGVAWQVADLSISLMDDPRRSPRRFAVVHP